MVEAILTFLALLAHIGDYLQTRMIAKHPERWFEINPIIGRRPTQTRVALYFIATAVLLIALILNIKNDIVSASLAGAWLAVGIYSVVRNRYFVGIPFGE